MAKQRTFGDLRPGSYFWTANQSGINRVAVLYIHNVGTDSISISFSYYKPSQTANKADRAIENEPARIYWYVDKKDAQRKAIDLKKQSIKKMEQELSRMYRELANMMDKYKVW